MIRFLPEWHPQDAILLTWPHRESAWQLTLNQVENTYIDLVAVISHHQACLVQLHPSVDITVLARKLADAGTNLSRCYFVACESNDTWARDHGPISIQTGETSQLLNFQFNGWGNKFEHALDNQLNQYMSDQGVFTVPMESSTWVLEGGSLEVDEFGTLLTTEQCLLNKNRNPQANKANIESYLKESLGVKRVLWLSEGELDGDDTDAHIDTLARFGPNNQIIFQGCQDETDVHFTSLNAMHQQLASFRNEQGEPYHLIELPFPKAIYAEDGHRLPATYANFLITNDLVIVPSYADSADILAVEKVQLAFPSHRVVSIDARPLIEEHGSIHCISMQLTQHTVNFDYPFVRA
ncbi:agmatine/peptidylarginine deiminase [Reinekea sp.]|jgi:agmatine deiminase|uniref:agmatine deiminase family protein n=1 Tax=Reinekea sp. TaxID=1970455 RepID=UPI003988DB28